METSGTVTAEGVSQGSFFEPTATTIDNEELLTIPYTSMLLQFVGGLLVGAVNILVIRSVKRWKGLSRPTRLLFQHIACCDILHGTSNGIKALLVVCGLNTRLTCILPLSVSICSGCCSISLMLLLGIDTFHASKELANSVGQLDSHVNEKRLLKIKVSIFAILLLSMFKY